MKRDIRSYLPDTKCNKEDMTVSIERINNDLCTGCGICAESCPMDVIRIDDKGKKAIIEYPDDCVLCGWCTLDCPQNAIYIAPEKKSPLLTSWG